MNNVGANPPAAGVVSNVANAPAAGAVYNVGANPPAAGVANNVANAPAAAVVNNFGANAPAGGVVNNAANAQAAAAANAARAAREKKVIYILLALLIVAKLGIIIWMVLVLVGIIHPADK